MLEQFDIRRARTVRQLESGKGSQTTPSKQARGEMRCAERLDSTIVSRIAGWLGFSASHNFSAFRVLQLASQSQSAVYRTLPTFIAPNTQQTINYILWPLSPPPSSLIRC